MLARVKNISSDLVSPYIEHIFLLEAIYAWNSYISGCDKKFSLQPVEGLNLICKNALFTWDKNFEILFLNHKMSY